MTKSNDSAVREIEEAMQRVKQAQNLINASLDPMALLESNAKETVSSNSR